MSKEEKKVRVMAFVLYTDNEAHMKARDVLFNSYSSVGILHNRDWYTEDTENHSRGEIKKEHYHILVRFKNARYRSSVAKELGIEERHIECVKNFNSYACYLTHKDLIDKAQYTVDELQGSLKATVIKLLSDETPEERFSRLLQLLNTYKGNNLLEFAQICLDNNLYDCFKSNSYFIVQTIKRGV